MGLNPKSENIEGGLKVYTTTGDVPSENIRVEGVDLTVDGDSAIFSVSTDSVVTGLKSVLTSVDTWSAGNGTITLERLIPGVAPGAGTSIGTLTLTQSGGTEGDVDESSNLSAVQLAAGDRLQLANSGNVTATACLASVEIQLTRV